MTLEGLSQHTPLTLRSIFERMRSVHGDGEVVDATRRTTYEELAVRVLRLARVLVERFGVRPGDRVGTFAFNSARHFELYHAVPLVGAVLHTINVRLHPDQIAYVVGHAEDRIVFCDAETVPALSEMAPKLDGVEAFVRMGAGDAGDLVPCFDYDDLVEDSAPIDERTLPDVPETAAFGLCYTSGTTAMPKGVLTSHRAMWLHSMATSMANHLALTERDRVLPVVPMFHAFGWGLPYAAPFAGAELVFHGSDSSAQNLARVIDRERVTVTAGVPTLWKELLPLLRSGALRATTLRNIFVGGSALPRPLIDAYLDAGIEIVQMWGMTETGPLACVSRPRRTHGELDRDAELDVRAKTGTIWPGLEARVVGDDGDALPRDGRSVGELEVRGPWIASAYYRDESSSERFRDGWLRTGDMAWMEPDGTFRIVDRAKDLVKSGGEWISSVELEGRLLGHPKVLDAAVIGVRSRKWDERPAAVVVPAPGEQPTLESVREFLSETVARWWLPDALVLVDEIPRTSVGKIDKKALRAQLDTMELP